MNKPLITRFAPSPTGYLHIGGARTALFNYIYAKHYDGKFLLRIEDTDQKRSTQEAVAAILNGLQWLEITPDEPPVFQMQQVNRHIQCAYQLLESGNAYKCFCTKEELEQQRLKAEKNGESFMYNGKCRGLSLAEQPQDKPYALRIKAEKVGLTTVEDLVMGKIEVKNATLDDFIILRTNKTPTYMFAVVVDDHDMEITHVIRGADHLTNTFRQIQIYKAFNWSIPFFAHLPLIHSPSGGKMSKRHGAVAVEEYKNLGFLPEAIKNYLLLLGWSFGTQEIISLDEAIKIFDIKDVNKSSAQFDIDKLKNINFQYLRKKSNPELIKLMDEIKDTIYKKEDINPLYKEYLTKGLEPIKERSKTIVELLHNSSFYMVKFPLAQLKPEDISILNRDNKLLSQQINLLEAQEDFSRNSLHNLIKDFTTTNNIKLADATKTLRILLCGSSVSAASVFDIMSVLGKKESLQRIKYGHYILKSPNPVK